MNRWRWRGGPKCGSPEADASRSEWSDWTAGEPPKVLLEGVEVEVEDRQGRFRFVARAAGEFYRIPPDPADFIDFRGPAELL